jgi:hypothetical protein
MISFSVKRSLFIEERGRQVMRREEWVRGDIRMSSESGTHLEFVIVTGAVAVDRQRTGTAVWLRSLSMEV